MKIAIVSGGTGGHIYPALALRQYLQDQSWQVEFFTSENVTALKILKAENVAFKSVVCRPIVGQSIVGKMQSVFYNLKGFYQARQTLKKMQVQAVVGFGAYASLPVIVAAYSLGLPCILHEQNPHPGKANKILSLLAQAVAVSFKQTQSYFKNCRTELVGNLLRREILSLPGQDQKQPHNDSPITILIVGGSGGAHTINNWFVQIAPDLKAIASAIKIIHVSGNAADSAVLKQAYAQAGLDAQVLDYAAKIWQLYACCDLVVARAGATTIAELAALKLPAILIPYPFALGHQKANAEILAGIDCAVIVEESQGINFLMANLRRIITNKNAYYAMLRSYAEFQPDLRQSLFKMQRLIEDVCQKK